MGSVSFRNVVKVFNTGTPDEVIAVNNCNLTINDGEFLVFVGPSGCGKSTSLRLIAGLERPTSGRIFIGDRDITMLHPRARNIAMVFQDYALYPHMTVKQNLSFGLQNLRYPKEEVQKRVSDVARILGIEELLDRLPKKLSGGQRQRVALGRAIVRHPEVSYLMSPSPTWMPSPSADACRTRQIAADAWNDDCICHARPGRSMTWAIGSW